MRRKESGFTMVEILTVVGIIAMLVAVLIPTLTMVRRIAKETKQTAQLTAIDLALTAFKSDDGDYPPSGWNEPPDYKQDYCGSQKLAEALLGLDLLGFHQDSDWNADGYDDSGNDLYPDNLDPTNPTDLKNLNDRIGPYLDVAAANAFRLGISEPGKRDGLFVDTTPLERNTFVICDIFSAKNITLSLPGTGGKTITLKAGAPILYYRADTSKKTIHTVGTNDRIYNVYDNLPLIHLKRVDDQKEHPLMDSAGTYRFFYEEYIRDPKVTAMPWPYRPDSYILISAGADGLYGTEDDIRNF